jgi:hypothetical protein
MIKKELVRDNLLIQCLNNPERIISLDLKQWTRLIHLSKMSNLTAHLAWLIELQQLQEHVPVEVQKHFVAAKAMVAYRQRLALWEINRLHRVLKSIEIKMILLKGSAYLVSGMPFAQGRLFADVDILVEKKVIEQVEQTLLAHDWQTQKFDAYDQDYYRRWMHEIPPLRHMLRSIEVDVHHTIIPPVSRLQPDASVLINSSIMVSNSQCYVLSPCDMLLHSAVHLFFDSDFNNRLKDLVDIDQLLRLFAVNERNFFQELLERAIQLGLSRPLFYAIHYSVVFFETPIPKNDLKLFYKKFSPPLFFQYFMDILVPLAILPEPYGMSSFQIKIARQVLYVRSHFLRMPLHLLVPHLFHKSKLRWQN